MRKNKLAISGLYLVCLVGPACGVTTWKGGVSGYWDTSSNWAGGYPASNSTVRLNHDRQIEAYTVVVRSPAITDKLWIDTYGEVPIHVRVNDTGSLQLNSMRMGFKEGDRESSFTIDGGSVWGLDPVDPAITNTAFLIGNNPDCAATLDIRNDGQLSVQGANGLIVASSKESAGHLVITNGNLHIRDSLILGKGPEANGEMSIAGTSSVSITGALHIAKLDNGALMPTGMVHMTEGTLECGTLNVGAHGNGSLQLLGGGIDVGEGGITVGLSNADGWLEIHGGMLQTTNSFMNIGHTDSVGHLSMSDGALHISGPIRVGSGSRSHGRIDQFGGTLSASQLIVGEPVSSSAAVNLFGGALHIQDANKTALQISNSCIHLQQTLIQWASSNVTDWVTSAVNTASLSFSNGVAPGTYSTNGYDGRIISGTAALYWDNLDNGSQFAQSGIWVEELSPYEAWAAGYELDPADLLGDPDEDGLDNLSEYALGGNPTNHTDSSILPTFEMMESGGSNWFEYVYRKRTDAEEVGLHYYLELNTNLVAGSWTQEGYLISDPSGNYAGFELITNRIPIEPYAERYIRLRISAE